MPLQQHDITLMTLNLSREIRRLLTLGSILEIVQDHIDIPNANRLVF